MKKYLNQFKDKKFIISILCLLGPQYIFYILTKNVNTNYHVFNFFLDNQIPFIPQMALIYNIFYPMIFIAFFFIYPHDKDTYYKGIIAGTMGYLIADTIFMIYPVEMIRPDISNLNIDPISNLLIYLTYKYDTPAINCFPSMHCVFCFQAIYSTLKCINLNKKYRIITVIILFLISISTLLVKQHYVFDVLAALLIVIVVNIISSLIYKKIKHKLNS